jgi:hypothetical protein
MHVFLDDQRLVVLEMDNFGAHRIYPRGCAVEQTWPHYRAVAEVLRTWLAGEAGQTLQPPHWTSPVDPGSSQYPRALVQQLNHDPAMGLWAYVTPLNIKVTQRQVGIAMGRLPDAVFRSDLEARGVSFELASGQRYLTDLGEVTQVLGQQIADRIVLRPSQVAAFLGVGSHTARRVIQRLNIELDPEGAVEARWGEVRRIRRTGQRSFHLG